MNKSIPTILSYGGGVQTFALLLLILEGKIEKPQFVIFSDTKAEYPLTYIHIDKYAKPICEILDIPFITVQHQDGIIDGYTNQNSIPMAGFRSCTYNYKIRPINKYLTEFLGSSKIKGKPSIISLIGISTDESKRAIPRNKQSPKWVYLKYPLLELDLSRRQLIDIINKSPYPLPIKSGCFICPYNGLKGFVDLKQNHKDLFKIAVEMEENYFIHRPERTHGFLQDSQIKLKELGQIPSLYSFVNTLPNENNECETGGCFL